MPLITFQPSGVTIEVKPGTTVFHAAARAEVAIPSQCGGKCACALCRVTLVAGEGVVSPMRWEEEGHLGNAFFLTRERLSCQTQVFGDVTVRIDEPDAREKPKQRYVPHALQAKREALEREADRRDAAGRREGRPPRPERGPPPQGADRRETGPPDPRSARPQRDDRSSDPVPHGAASSGPRPPQGLGSDHRPPRPPRPPQGDRPTRRRRSGPRPGDSRPPGADDR